MVRSFYLAVLLSTCMMGFGSWSVADEGPKPAAGEHGPTDGDNAAASHVEDQGAAHAAAEPGGDAHGGDAHGGDAHNGGHGSTNPLSVDPDLLIFTLLTFALAYVVLGKFAWKPIASALERRDAWVAAQLAEAQVHSDASQRLLKEHQEKLAVATEEVRSLLNQARQAADAEKQAVLDAAQQEAAAKKDEALRVIGAAKGAALHDLAGTSVNTALDLAGRIVGRTLDRQDHEHLIEDAVKQFQEAPH
jgi:F-type H+-transporting ATPase subunit b